MRTVALVLMLAACAPSGMPGAPSPAAAPLGFVPGPAGVGVPGSRLEVGFGRAEPGARAALARLAGPAVVETPCLDGGRRVEMREGLAAVYRGGRFLGWEFDGARAGAACPR